MTNFEKHIEKAGKHYSLSDAEKARIERVLKSYMSFKPVRGEATASNSGTLWFFYMHRTIAAALIFAVATSSSAVYAAESSLPGDALYGVKTSVNEPVRVAFATNAEAKAEIQIEIAERRIEEATTLAAEGRLDDSTQDELAASFKSYAAAASESIAKADEEDDSASTELASRFETRLAAHEMILAEVEVEMEGETEEHSRRLSDAVRATSELLFKERNNRELALNIEVGTETEDISLAATITTDSEGVALSAEPAAATMMMATSEPAADTARATAAAKMDVALEAPSVPQLEQKSAPSEKRVLRMKSAAEKSLRTVERSLQKSRALSVDAKARAEADIERAEELLEIGTELLNDDLRAEAFIEFQESLRVSEQTNVYIKAAPTLEKARARNSSRNRATETSKGASVNVSLPGASLNATVTATTSSDSRGGADDGPNHDATDDPGNDDLTRDPNDDYGDDGPEDGDDHRGNSGSDDSGSSLKLLQKLNISL
ncbi:MAG: DUF5667 domain-containing protein [Minisyncoccia bacterium]